MRLAILLLVVWLPSLRAQSSIAHNKIEFNNWWITDREDAFPNYATPAGNGSGDGLFKVFPAEVCERAENHRLSGYQIALSIDDAYAGAFPVMIDVPAVQLYRSRSASLAGATYDVPDLSQPIGAQIAPIAGVSIPADSAWVFGVRLRTPIEVAPAVGANRSGIALMVLGKPGDRRAANVPGVVLQSSFAERHFAPGRASYSGSFDASTNALRMFGTSGMPSATGELYVGLRFDNPTLQLAGPSAGGLADDPQRFETRLGPGAYATDLARRLTPGHFRLFVQAEQFDPEGGAPTHHVFPLVVALGAAGPTAAMPVGGVSLRVDPAALGVATVLIEAGLAGMLARLPAASAAGFDVEQRGAWTSAPIPLAPSPALVGRQIWLQALVTNTAYVPVASTNVVRLSL